MQPTHRLAITRKSNVNGLGIVVPFRRDRRLAGLQRVFKSGPGFIRGPARVRTLFRGQRTDRPEQRCKLAAASNETTAPVIQSIHAGAAKFIQRLGDEAINLLLQRKSSETR